VFALNASKSSQNQEKKGAYKKTLKALLPYGMLATKKWLREHELSAHAIDNAVKTETLLLLTSGVYSQYSRNLRWEGAVASLQRMELDDIDDELTVPPTHAGGVTALALSGFSQYLSMGNSPTIHLYS
jgi:putative lipase involved disintegration of autophagic bodies